MKGHCKIYQGSYWGPFSSLYLHFPCCLIVNYCHVMEALVSLPCSGSARACKLFYGELMHSVFVGIEL
jgi:hypothetical protein